MGRRRARSSRRSSRSSRKRRRLRDRRRDARGRAWSAGSTTGPFDELAAQGASVRLSATRSPTSSKHQKWGPEQSSREAASRRRLGGRRRNRRHRHRPHRARLRQGRLPPRQGAGPRPPSPRSTTPASSSPASASSPASPRPIPPPPTGSSTTSPRRAVLFAVEKYPHSYPHCWRCKTELLFRLVDEWFIDMKWRDEIMKVVEQRHVPPRVDQRPGPRARLAQEHGRLDDLQETLLGPGPADLGRRRDRRFRGHRLAARN